MSSPSITPVLWEAVKCDLKGLFPEDVFNAWFEPIVAIESGEESLVLGVPNEFAVIWVHENYLDLITQRVRLVSGRMVSVTLRKIEGGGREGPRPDARTRASAAPARRSPPRQGRGPFTVSGELQSAEHV